MWSVKVGQSVVNVNKSLVKGLAIKSTAVNANKQFNGWILVQMSCGYFPKGRLSNGPLQSFENGWWKLFVPIIFDLLSISERFGDI